MINHDHHHHHHQHTHTQFISPSVSRLVTVCLSVWSIWWLIVKILLALPRPWIYIHSLSSYHVGLITVRTQNLGFFLSSWSGLGPRVQSSQLCECRHEWILQIWMDTFIHSFMLGISIAFSFLDVAFQWESVRYRNAPNNNIGIPFCFSQVYGWLLPWDYVQRASLVRKSAPSHLTKRILPLLGWALQMRWKYMCKHSVFQKTLSQWSSFQVLIGLALKYACKRCAEILPVMITTFRTESRHEHIKCRRLCPMTCVCFEPTLSWIVYFGSIFDQSYR